MDLVDQAVEDIQQMRVRGAAAIARYAADVLRRVIVEGGDASTEDLLLRLEASASKLLSSRPTAVSLPNSIRFVMHKAKQLKDNSPVNFKHGIDESVNTFIEGTLKMVDTIAKFGARRIVNGDNLLTHCNSSAVVAILKRAYREGKSFKVYITETRPRLQGRITAKQLGEEGIETYMIVDSAARYFINEVDRVIVGADAIAANGAVINKIGTSMLASVAHEARTQFLVAAETLKFSPETMLGELVWIEERNPNEVISTKELGQIPLCEIRNPSFDVTPPEYIDALITEEGIISPQTVFYLMQKIFGKFNRDELASYQTIKPNEDD